MPEKKTIVAPIPQDWLQAVIPLLRKGAPNEIDWTARALRDMQSIGFAFEYEVYEFILQTLIIPGILGERIHDMRGERDGSIYETWAFLCPHPLVPANHVYVKIGLHQDKLVITLFSVHVDLSGKLERAIRNHRK